MKTKLILLALALIIGAAVTIIYLINWGEKMHLAAPQYCVASFYGAIIPTLTSVSIFSKRK